MSALGGGGPVADIRNARDRYPATQRWAYFNTAAVGLASRALAATYHRYVDDWTESGPDFVRGEAAGEAARTAVARLVGADAADVALIASVSAAAGLVASQFGPAGRGQNVVIGEREYSSNHFPWRLLGNKGYEVRQVPFRNGGLEPEANRSAIVSVPLGDADPVALLAQLKERGVVGAARDGNLRLAVHFYNHEDDIERLTSALTAGR